MCGGLGGGWGELESAIPLCVRCFFTPNSREGLNRRWVEVSCPNAHMHGEGRDRRKKSKQMHSVCDDYEEGGFDRMCGEKDKIGLLEKFSAEIVWLNVVLSAF